MTTVRLSHLCEAARRLRADHIPEMLYAAAWWLAEGLDPDAEERDPFRLGQGLAEGAALSALRDFDDPADPPYVDYGADPWPVVLLRDGVNGRDRVDLLEPTGLMLSRAGRGNHFERVAHVVREMTGMSQDTALELSYADAACIYSVYTSFLLFPPGFRPWELERAAAMPTPMAPETD